MKALLYSAAVSFLVLISLTPNVGAANCEEISDNDPYDYYSPSEAFDFGSKIQDLVRDKDLEGLFNLVVGELVYGPRRSFAMSKSFDEIFDTRWVNNVLSDPPPCFPWGWRGFDLGNGTLRFDYSDPHWRIWAMSGVAEEEVGIPSIGWFRGNKLLHSSCFARRRIGENRQFRSLSDQFKISDYEQFLGAPGEFFGREISDYNNSLIRNIDSCSLTDLSFVIMNGEVMTKDQETYGYSAEFFSRVIREFDNDKCSALAPNIGSECMQSYLMEVGDFAGGTIGRDEDYGIYGIFQLDDVGLSVVPLRYFGSQNSGLNFIDYH